MNTYAPIILFVYNRLEHTKKVIDGLLNNPEAPNCELYIFSDGPKDGANQEDMDKISDVRKFIRNISGFKTIHIEESEKNKGLAKSTIYGCTKVINKYGKMIMLEDDDVPNKYFLSYINKALYKYENDKQVWCVSAYTDTSILKPNNGDDLFYVNRPSSWGFGTWKRCWDKVIWDIETLKGIFSHKDIIHGFNQWAGLDSSTIMLNLFKGNNSSWSIRYNFAAYLNKSLTILPNKTLIENIGCDGSGTHCGYIKYKLEMMDHNVIFPNEIKFDKKRNKDLWNSFKPTFKDRLRYVKSLLTNKQNNNLLR